MNKKSKYGRKCKPCDYQNKRRCYEADQNQEKISIDSTNEFNIDAYEFEQLVTADINGVKSALKSLRKALNMSTSEVGRIANVSYQTLVNIEDCDRSGTRLSSVVRYKNMLELIADQKELPMRAAICAEMINTLDRPTRDLLFRYYNYVQADERNN